MGRPRSSPRRPGEERPRRSCPASSAGSSWRAAYAGLVNDYKYRLLSIATNERPCIAVDAPMSDTPTARETAALVDLMWLVMRRIWDHAEERLAPYSLSLKHNWALHALDEPMSMSALADRLGIDASYVTTIADQLEERGLIERQPHPTDRRDQEPGPHGGGTATPREARGRAVGRCAGPRCAHGRRTTRALAAPLADRRRVTGSLSRPRA